MMIAITHKIIHKLKNQLYNDLHCKELASSLAIVNREF